MSGLFHRVDFCSALSSSMGVALMSDGLSASRAVRGALRVGRLARKSRRFVPEEPKPEETECL